MRLLKTAYYMVLVIAVMLTMTLADARAQALPPSGGASANNPPETVWNAPDYLTNQERSAGVKKTKLDLKDTMNFEECVDHKRTPGGSGCKSACGSGKGIGLMQYDYYEPIALVESVPKPWATLFNDTENFISKAFTKFQKTPFGGDEGVQTIRTTMGNFPQRYFETHVWGISIPTRFLMLIHEAATTPPNDPRMIGMVNSLTYEIGLIAAELTGASEINSLDDFFRMFKNMILTFFSAGTYIIIKILEAIKAIYDVVKSLYDIFTEFMNLLSALTALINDPLHKAIEALVKLVLGKECAEKPSSAVTGGNSAYYTVPNYGSTTPTPTLGPVYGSDSNANDGPIIDNNKDNCKPSEDSLFAKLNKAIEKMIKSLERKFGEIVTALQIKKAFKVFGNFAKSITTGLKDFAEGWTKEAGEAANQVGEAAKTCTNPDWLCSAQQDLGNASGQNSPLWGAPDYTGTGTGVGNPPNGGPAMQGVTSANTTVNQRITELGGSCRNGQAVGNWGDRVSTCDSGAAGGALEAFSRAITAVNRIQDVFRSGSITNVMGAAAGSLIPIGLIPSYISEFDRPAWNKGTPNFVSLFQSMVATKPWLCASSEVAGAMGGQALTGAIREAFCIGIWGPLYPKVGAVPVENWYTAAAVTNFRAFSLAASWGTLPVPYNGRKSGIIRFNQDHPYKGTCYKVGTPDPRWMSTDQNTGRSPALNSMTGGLSGAVGNVNYVLKAIEEKPRTDVQEGSEPDGFVQTYWKKTRVCMSLCKKGFSLVAKWEKVY